MRYKHEIIHLTTKQDKMKKLLLVLAIGAFVACNDNAAETKTDATVDSTTTVTVDTTTTVTVDTTMAPAAADTIKK